MKDHYAQINAHGVPVLVQPVAASGFVTVPDDIDPWVSMYVGGVWAPRPKIGVSVTGAELVLTNVPNGTSLEIVDIALNMVIAEEVLTGDDTIQFAEAGSYQIDLRPPMPHLGWQGVLTC